MSAKENLTNLNTWIRGAFIILFGIVFYIAYAWLVWLLVLFQFVTKLLTGKPNEQLLEISPRVTTYAHDILLYVTFQTDVKPWPLSQVKAGEDSTEPASPTTVPAAATGEAKPEPKKGAKSANSAKEDKPEKDS